MSDPSGPDQEPSRTDAEADTEAGRTHDDPATEVFAAPDQANQQTEPAITPGERRYTAPSGMDAGSTQIIGRTADEPATEVFAPRSIRRSPDPGRGPARPGRRPSRRAPTHPRSRAASAAGAGSSPWSW
ncbi:Uncharacterised protein [Mycolicibacterium tokaiense]|uniref:Uncharacterized protein n=1 Tax=Mycolicibacterium tokaiense TaxID=39695 RepID=A0A378TIA6_9MYCO|nr:Uncharacterised protein [Mycolicibacterium tokaiense]